jgi:5-formyltetrahydrofolate cyclo-ligase
MAVDPERELIEAKKSLRVAMRERLREMDDAGRRAASARGCERLLGLPAIQAARAVLFYLPTRTEISPLDAAEACRADGMTVALPRVDEGSDEIAIVAWESGDRADLVPDAVGMPAPAGGRILRVGEIDAAIVPGVAFDRAGRRLGRGGGFYDRLLVRLSERCPAIGFAFAAQLVDRVPEEPHDLRVAAVVTDAETVEIR